MKKGEATREMIIDRAARLFNTHGYSGASLSDIMRVTGLEKGGIYNHFKSKEALALEAFDHACRLVREPILKAIAGKTNAAERLVAYVSAYQDQVDHPVLEGGCPILNTAADADDSNPDLRVHAARAMSQRLDTVREMVLNGIERGEIRSEADPESLAALIITSLEGAILISMLYRDTSYMRNVINELKLHIARVALT